jgi:hypothetical protein
MQAWCLMLAAAPLFPALVPGVPMAQTKTYERECTTQYERGYKRSQIVSKCRSDSYTSPTIPLSAPGPPAPVSDYLRSVFRSLRRAEAAETMDDIRDYGEALKDVPTLAAALVDLSRDTPKSLLETRDALAAAVRAADSLHRIWSTERGNRERVIYLVGELSKPPNQRAPDVSEWNLNLARRREADSAQERRRRAEELSRHMERCKVVGAAVFDSTEMNKP